MSDLFNYIYERKHKKLCNTLTYKSYNVRTFYYDQDFDAYVAGDYVNIKTDDKYALITVSYHGEMYNDYPKIMFKYPGIDAENTKDLLNAIDNSINIHEIRYGDSYHVFENNFILRKHEFQGKITKIQYDMVNSRVEPNVYILSNPRYLSIEPTVQINVVEKTYTIYGLCGNVFKGAL